jgi:hypothetical protein
VALLVSDTHRECLKRVVFGCNVVRLRCEISRVLAHTEPQVHGVVHGDHAVRYWTCFASGSFGFMLMMQSWHFLGGLEPTSNGFVVRYLWQAEYPGNIQETSTVTIHNISMAWQGAVHCGSGAVDEAIHGSQHGLLLDV